MIIIDTSELTNLILQQVDLDNIEPPDENIVLTEYEIQEFGK